MANFKASTKMAFSIPLFVVVLLGLNMIRGFSNTKLERPIYTLIKESGSFQVRKYAPMVIARTLVDSEFKE